MSHHMYQLAGGSVVGRIHRTNYRNNQDSWRISNSPQATVAIIADGCGSATSSEIGAQLGVRFLETHILTHVATSSSMDALVWNRIQQHVLADIDSLARAMTSPLRSGSNDSRSPYRRTIEEFFLFTCIGIVIHPASEHAYFFGLGDGVLIINGHQYPLGPFEDNRPPYIAYNLLQHELKIDPTQLQLWHQSVELTELESFLIGTDGVLDAISAEDSQLPGLPKNTGGIEQFWQQDRYFGANPELVSRQLRLIGRDWPKVNPQPGLLPDDTTFVVGRRNPQFINSQATKEEE